MVALVHARVVPAASLQDSTARKGLFAFSKGTPRSYRGVEVRSASKHVKSAAVVQDTATTPEQAWVGEMAALAQEETDALERSLLEELWLAPEAEELLLSTNPSSAEPQAHVPTAEEEPTHFRTMEQLSSAVASTSGRSRGTDAAAAVADSPSPGFQNGPAVLEFVPSTRSGLPKRVRGNRGTAGRRRHLRENTQQDSVAGSQALLGPAAAAESAASSQDAWSLCQAVKEWKQAEIAAASGEGISQPEYAAKVSSGRQAMQTLEVQHRKMVLMFAKRYKKVPSGLSYHDFVQEGLAALRKAAEEYQPKKTTAKFSTYLYATLSNTLRHLLDHEGNVIRMPSNFNVERGKVVRSLRRLEADLGRPPTTAELAKATGMTQRRVLFVRDKMKVLDQAGQQWNDEVWESRGATAPGSSPDDSYVHFVMSREFAEDVEILLDSLGLEQSSIMKLRFGLDGDGKMRSYAEVGRLLGMSGERARGLALRAERKLREAGRLERLLPHLETFTGGRLISFDPYELST